MSFSFKNKIIKSNLNFNFYKLKASQKKLINVLYIYLNMRMQNVFNNFPKAFSFPVQITSVYKNPKNKYVF